MGCGTSAIRNYNKTRYVRNKVNYFEETEVVQPTYDAKDIIKMDIPKILQGVAQIKVPSQLSPIVCLSEHAYPLFIAGFIFDEQNDESLPLPVVCFSHKGRARFIYFGSLNILDHSILTYTETSAFIENLITWAADYKVSTIKVYLLGIETHLAKSVAKDFKVFGYSVEQGDDLPTTAFDIIITTSQCKKSDDLIKLAEEGTVIFIFFEQPYKKMKLSSFTGVAFPFCSLFSVESILKTYDEDKLESFTLDNIINKFFNIINNEPTTEELDFIISRLRYYISEIDCIKSNAVFDLYDKTLDYLEKNQYRQDNQICITTNQCLVSIILMEVIPKIPPKEMKPIPSIDIFPGKYEFDFCVNETDNFELNTGYLIPTGMWVPAGALCFITTSANITAQIGAHEQCILVKPGPWKRWPVTVITYKLKPGVKNEVNSPFGGPLYLIANESKKAKIKFEGFGKYPFFDYENPRTWVKTRNLSVNWGEIHSKHCDVVLLVRFMLTEEKLNGFCEFVDEILRTAKKVLGIKTVVRGRIVFDIESISESPMIYNGVVYAPHEYVQEWINIHTPERGLYRLLLLVIHVYIWDIFLDRDVELSIAACALRYSLEKVNSQCKLPEFLDSNPPKFFDPIFKVMKSVDEESFGSAVKKLALMKIDSSEDAWYSFVKFISETSKTDLKNDLKIELKPSLLSIVSSEKLSEYQIYD